MAVLIDAETRLICQGLTGRTATYHIARMIAYGTRLVGGVRPGKGGSTHLDAPMFDTVAAAMAATGANASIVFVPPATAAAAMIEAIEAAIPLVVVVTERVPVLDMVRVRDTLRGSATRLIGPNSQGILSPGGAQVGVMTTVAAMAGSVGIVSRSATLTSEVMAQTTLLGLGQSTTIGVGGDPVHGFSLLDGVRLLLDDAQTAGIVVIGEIGGRSEEDVAAFVAAHRPDKPIVALIAGRHAPPERRMGHAGAFVSHVTGNAEAKIAALSAAGVIIAPNAATAGATIAHALGGAT